MFDVLIKGGSVIDGTGNPWFKADVGIKGDRISAVGSLSDAKSNMIINATGLMVVPGLIDIHSHCDFVLPLKNHPNFMKCKIMQGITTDVVGNCGFSPAPVNEATLGLLRDYSNFLTPEELSWNWSSFAEFLDLLDRQGVAINVVPLVGHGSIRTAVMGMEARQATREELLMMKDLVAQTMKDGSFGMSTGLIYAPGQYADTNELVELCKIVAKFGGVYATHYRGEGPTLEKAVEELIKIGEEANVSVQQSHHTATGKDNWWKVRKTAEMIEAARRKGIDVTFDVIPYTSANSTILAVFPPWSLEGGVEELIERLGNTETRQKIKKDIKEVVPTWPPWIPGKWPHNIVGLIGWENVFISWCKSEENKEFEGKNIVEIAEIKGMDPFDAVSQLIIEEKGNILAHYIGFNGDLTNEDALQYLMKHRLASLCTDIIFLGKGKASPRDYGCFPRVLGRYVRVKKLLSLEECVRKITSLPASRFRLKDRGQIRESAFADLAIIDHNRITDKEPFTDSNPFPLGVEYVLINGKIVVEQGKFHTEVLAGRVMRKGSNT